LLITAAAAAAVIVAAAAQALRVALRQPAVAADPYVLSAAANTCRDWQPALQLGSFDVKVRVQPSLDQLQRLASWLPKHAGCVRSLSISLDEDAVFAREYDVEQIHELLLQAEELLLQALQPPQQSQAAAPAAAAAAAAAAAQAELQAPAPAAAAAAVDVPASSATVADDLSDLLAAASIAEAAAPSAAAAGDLRLTSFSSNCITAAGARVLPLLPAHTLTQLELQMFLPQTGATAESSDWCAGLARLTNLQHLQLYLDRSPAGTEVKNLEALQSSIAEACLAGIAQLSCLTSLDLSIRACDEWEEHSSSQAAGGLHITQQAIARQLQLRQLKLHVSPPAHWENSAYDSPALDLASLTQLTELHLDELSASTVLPRQLQRLYMETSMLTKRDIYYLASLPQLQHLHISHCNSSDLTSLTALGSLQSFQCEVWDHKQAELLGLAQVPLQKLALRYWNLPTTAADNAAAWSKLPQLQELHVLTDSYRPSKQQMSSILAGLTACSSLTKLTFDGSYSPLLDFVDNPDDVFLDPAQMAVVQQLADAAAAATGHISVCSSLAGLATLCDLTLSYAFEVPGNQRGDVLALTALTGLTRLVLAYSRAAVNDQAAAALAANLQQLRHLDLSYCDLGDMACVAAIGQTLTQLTELQLRGSGVMTKAGLMQLTNLQRLQQLGVDRNDEVTDAVLQELWAALPVRV
jgi:hypothetical protein